MSDKKPAKKEAWVKPQTKEMDVLELTKGNPGIGGDAAPFVDCTLS